MELVRRHLMPLAAGLILFTGCADGRGECGDPGDTQTCTCSSGATGVQTCSADGTFSGCVCDGVDAGPMVDSGPMPIVDSGPMVDAGPMTDAGTDAGPMTDAGTDAGPMTDAGGDAGPMVDAGTDAGPMVDAGTDAGLMVDAGTDAGPMVDAGTDAGPMVDAGSDAGMDAGTPTCDITGFTVESEATNRIASPDQLTHALTQGTAELSFEVFFGFGATTGARVIDFDDSENYSSCLYCTILRVTGGPTYFVRAGRLEFTTLTTNDMVGTLTNAELIEVTITPGTFVSTPVAGGDVWCIDSVAFDSTPTGCGNGTCDFFEDSVSCAADCDVSCGNGVCDGTETPEDCAADCVCGVFTPSTCAFGNRCGNAFTRTSDLTAVGVCGPPGATVEGETCANNFDCAGRVCLNRTGGPTCGGEICDPLGHETGAPACPGGEGCRDLFDGDGDHVPFGVCETTCDPFTTTGCSSGDWCRPWIQSRSAGFCVEVGTETEGASCDAANPCEFGALCIGGICEAVCDISAASSSCSGGRACGRLLDTDPASGEMVERAYGLCVPGCDFDGGTSCATGVCVADEVAIGVGDLCLDFTPLAAGDACAPDATPNQFCNGLGVCLDRGAPALTCTDLCREGTGTSAFGSTSHPDCPGGTTCTGTAGDGIGVCL
ncbi:MAG: hypothetical protein AB8I08_24835 [Sandaracinaceae bacterium]